MTLCDTTLSSGICESHKLKRESKVRRASCKASIDILASNSCSFHFGEFYYLCLSPFRLSKSPPRESTRKSVRIHGQHFNGRTKHVVNLSDTEEHAAGAVSLPRQRPLPSLSQPLSHSFLSASVLPICVS